MGTRSLTTFIESSKNKEGKKVSKKIVTMYRQFDGYPSGMGADLANFLSAGKLVNGISSVEKELVFNGMGCLAAQVVAYFQYSADGFYLQRESKGSGEEYRYEVIGDFGTKELTMKVYAVGFVSKKGKYIDKTKLLFNGTPKQFLESDLMKKE